MRLVVQADGAWLTARTGYAPSGDFRALVAIREDGTVAGMVGFDGWTPESVHMHIALEAPAAGRCLLRPAFAEAFAGARTRAIGVIRGGNTRSLRVAQHLGFREVYRMVDGWAKGEDVVLFEMRREECRWL